MTKKAPIAFLLFLGAAAAARAGEIYGTLFESGKPVAAGVTVRVACPGGSADGATDAYGAYSVKVAATGKCTLSVDGKPGASLAVNVYDKSARYDLVLSPAGGKYSLSRK